ncbi:SDR family oxidoreductase [Mycobacterium sp. 1423905.2]|uniref:SDR family oxidoreductase n=1 Tax=Mycobacterium sp. 1423905.2 TaxID=1856859 RepID=UPI0008017900|nr:SDR family oxidoreductase [Mycobacterium sp. 1423905.2]OBJ50875.1 NAD-dependent epimerase [Mycobacterium sp. 1423905.2]
MATYAVTGSASGMGQASARRLHAAGHRVIGVDIRKADVVADLSTPSGRAHAAREVLERTQGRLDGVVLAAGLGPSGGTGNLRRIAEVNFFGVVELLTRWQPALAAAEHAKVVVISSNSTTTVPVVPKRTVRALLSGDANRAVRSLVVYGPGRPIMMYAASKIAVTRWVRREAIRPGWAGAGIRLNALAPGAVMTPLLQQQLDSAAQGKAVRRFPVPVGGFGDADQLGQWVCFMLSEAADFCCGSVVFVDGGTDAHFRTDDWPRPVPARRLIGYLRSFLQ